MYDECTSKKGSNEVISFLKQYFDNVLNTSIKKPYLFSDNCVQNKNDNLVQLLFADDIVHRFPEPGYSVLPCDRCFGRIEKNISKTEKICIPQEYKTLMNNTSPKKFFVIDVKQYDV
ncbi:hypothetical protein PR048_010201 [Dryococelus australis]|uniref:Polyprotein n=1 Tax=Dryococelus australis TaxID=614101 RepID=A0ABQ9I2J3_9NEOP|nr:hypothetical protein PR048_010201 [Dryococelus australis]